MRLKAPYSGAMVEAEGDTANALIERGYVRVEKPKAEAEAPEDKKPKAKAKKKG